MHGWGAPPLRGVGGGGWAGGGGRGGGYDLVSKECSWDLSVSHLKFLSISVAL